MEIEKLFLSQWNDRFPDVTPPTTSYADPSDVEASFSICKRLIKKLTEELNQQNLYLTFLQACLTADRSDNTQDKDHDHAKVSSVEPADDNDDANKSSLLENGSDKMDFHNDDFQCIPNDSSVPVCQDGNDMTLKGKHLSKVPENSKASETNTNSNGRDPHEIPADENEENTNLQKSSSNVKVWDGRVNEVEEENSINNNYTKVIKTSGRNKPQANSRQRQDYVEVWQCSTGEQVDLSGVYDGHNGFKPPPRRYSENLNGVKDNGYTAIDMKGPSCKERHNTMDGSKVKLRTNDVSRNKGARMTWQASVESWRDNENDEDYLSGEIDFDSDLDDEKLSSSQRSGSSCNNSIDSFAEAHATNNTESGDFLEVSPLHKLRRARTTNERMSVAFSAFQPEWSDDDHNSHGRSSIPSMELHSSDDDLVLDDHSEDDLVTPAPFTAPVNSSNSESMFVFSRTKSASILSKEDVAPDADKTDVGTVSKTSDSNKNVAVSALVDYQKVRNIEEAEKLRMRRMVLSSLLDTEQAYLDYLDTLLLYMKPLKATIGTSQPVMSSQDFDVLFYRVPELHSLHTEFYKKLKPQLDDWSADTNVGELFKELLSKLNYYNDYLNNYKRAQHTVEKCARENVQFAQIIENLKVKSGGGKNSQSISLIEVLYKPVERVMRTTLVLQDLLKHTPHRHPDYQMLRQVLKQSQQFLERINSSSSFKPRKVPSSAAAAARSADRELIKDGFLVEVAGDGGRKLRHCFLYNDILLCAKQKNAAGVFHSKDSYECKWYIPLADLSFQPNEDSDNLPDVPVTGEDELRDLSNKAQQLKRDIIRENKRNAQAKSSEGSPVKSRREDRLKKKLAEIEARIVLIAPDLALKIYHMQGKCYLFLMSSDYERIEWTEAIMKQQETCFKSFSLTSFEINHLLAACVRQRKMNNLGSMWLKDEEDLLCGYLNVTIHSAQGFLRACNPYCTLEVDSYGQFQTEAKTRPCHGTKSPLWNEEFEIDLDGAMTLRILCYDRAREASAGASYDDDVLIAKGKVELNQGSLRNNGEMKEELVTMNGLSIRVSVRYVPSERGLQRLHSNKKNGVFGVEIATTAKRDSSGIPGIVRKCIAEVGRRGMDEVGIYRVSGVASGIQSLKTSFDTNRKDVTLLLGEVDIHAVAGVLKLYFRELPEPLFTNSRYSDFVAASSLTDPDTKLCTMSRLIADLPSANHKTLRYLRKHLLKVAENEAVNRMSLHNLATVFGPTLLRPAEEKTPSSNVMSLHALRLDVHFQMDVLLYCLEHEEMFEKGVEKSNHEKEPVMPGNASKNEAPDTSQAADPAVGINSKTFKSSEPVKSNASVSTTIAAPPFSNHPRYHAYEEIFIPPKLQDSSPKPVIMGKPNVATKPKPAPRRSLPQNKY